jgi:adenylate cyclase
MTGGGGRVGRLASALAAPLAGVAVLAAAIVLLVGVPGIKDRFLDFSYDTLQRLDPRVYSPAPVRIVDIDEESLARLGQWPWPRTRVAKLVERLREQGAASIAFDIVFSEPDRTSPQRVADNWPDSPELRALIKDLPDHDTVLAETIRGGRVVTGFVLNNATTHDPVVKARFVTSGEDPRPYLEKFPGATASLAPLETAAAGNGALNFLPERDGIVRRVPLAFVHDGKLHPGLAAEALRVGMGAPNIIVRGLNPEAQGNRGIEPGVNSVVIGRTPVPTDHHANLWLYFTRPVPERYVPVWQVLDGDTRRAELDGSIVFVGTSAAGLQDLRFGPLGLMPGVEAHAQAAEQILAGDFLQRQDGAAAIELLATVLGALVVVTLVPLLGALWPAIVVLAMCGAGLGAVWYAFTEHRLLFEPLSPTFTAIVVFLVASVVQHIRSERQGRWIRQAFSQYISPNLVEHLIDHPERLRLGGERRECSFVLTDLAGFTTVVERSDPAALVSLMNEYLDGMVGIAFRNEGTLDRIVGDAVAVMFSAPVEQPDHAERAVACALEMDAWAQQFKAAKNAAGVPLGNTRIGVHCGTVIVGNFGGQQTFDYRALGDAINTTARLETVNRHLGTRVCVSGEIAAACPDFAGRPIGDLVLKGKSEPVAAFEPLPRERLIDKRIVEYRAAYKLLAAEDAGAAAAFDALAEQYPDDPLVVFHRDRLARGETGTVVVMQEK